MLQFFRVVSLIEGLSYLLILCVTLGVINRELVFYLGMGHGILFLLYLSLSAVVSHKQSWPIVIWLLVIVASVIPFAFIPVEIFIKRELAKIESST
ncbi:hypothetical protein GCM10008090_24620 [Arenicella chitinivorans]|uniref:DUF3817 domain-containing protein n=1 Tax=Arenicella chitinivorans TaxID=1329800 RepID=A0A918RWR1_9GAMM|nr:DUF3817 domain-containing protein [Arenicella chitinivorans]GHA13918.1 hypothetical protein GCM10008090_24620 [Arenicella chitinivorans]